MIDDAYVQRLKKNWSWAKRDIEYLNRRIESLELLCTQKIQWVWWAVFFFIAVALCAASAISFQIDALRDEGVPVLFALPGVLLGLFTFAALAERKSELKSAPSELSSFKLKLAESELSAQQAETDYREASDEFNSNREFIRKLLKDPGAREAFKIMETENTELGSKFRAVRAGGNAIDEAAVAHGWTPEVVAALHAAFTHTPSA